MVCGVVVFEFRVGDFELLWWVVSEVFEGKSWLCLGVLFRGLRWSFVL